MKTLLIWKKTIYLSKMDIFFTISYNESLKRLKKNLGSRCTMVSNRIDKTGARFVDVNLKIDKKVKKLTYEFPHDLKVVKGVDYEYLEELIREEF